LDDAMTPATLSKWTTEVLIELLSQGLFETEEFDFKETLPSDEKGRDRLRSACCAFANAAGGFLVFGVKDDRSACPQDRLVGLDRHLDFPERFGNFPGQCTPSVNWSFLNPPLKLSNDRVIHIVHVPKSWKAPHAVGEPGVGWRFPKRTNKGTEHMGIDEVRSSFLAFYEKRMRLQLLRAELSILRDHAAEAMIRDPTKKETNYSLVTFDVTVIESVLSDTYPLTTSSPALLEILARLRHEVMIANNKIRLFFGTITLPRSNMGAIVRQHNEFMAAKCAGIGALCSDAIEALNPLVEP
jgi:hypothetical protein